MNILVTGGAGFLGSHVADALVNVADVRVVDDLSTGRAEWSPVPVLTEDFGGADEELRGCDAIVHCAAVADISKNWTPDHNRPRIFSANVWSLHCMLERLAKGTTCRRFVFVSTAAVHAPQQSPYTASKLAGEAMVRAYCQALNIRLTIVRPVSMLGKRYHHGHIADFVRMQQTEGVIRAKDNGMQRKPYVHVSEVVNRIVRHLAIDDPEAIEAYRNEIQSGEPCIDVVPGCAWGIAWTAKLMNCPIEFAHDLRGWTGDPDVMAFRPGDADAWVQETIEWCRKENRT